MIIAIMQPTFLPWMGYMSMIARVDAFVFLDNVQFEQRSWQSRNKIKLQDKIHFLSLSCQKAPQKTLLKDIKLSPNGGGQQNSVKGSVKGWTDKMLKTLHHAYSKSANYEKYFSLIQSKLNAHHKLCELNIDLISQFCKDLGIKTPLYRASDLNLPEAKKERLLLEICHFFKAQSYLSPEGSKAYLEDEKARELFKEKGVKILYFDFIHPLYKQQGKNFLAYLSIVDFLFNTPKPELEFQKIILENSHKIHTR
ncbi:WbqC family protein [Campylobacter sp. VTCC 70190]|uniref:WbqC family protein n=1 Tax=Campylobacter sp. VTCC 70190 TaxID=3392118 RepID=UPI00398E3504